MAQSGAQKEQRCPRCGARISPDWGFCWLCDVDLQEEEPLEVTEFRPERSPVRRVEKSRQNLDTAGAVVIFVAVGVTWLGVTLLAPGVGILLAIAAVPAVIRTMMVAAKRKESGRETSPVETGVMFLTSLVITGIMLGAAGFVAFWTFCIACLGTFAVGGRENTAMAISTLITVLAAIGVLLAFAPLIRRRYQRDIEKE